MRIHIYTFLELECKYLRGAHYSSYISRVSAAKYKFDMFFYKVDIVLLLFFKTYFCMQRHKLQNDISEIIFYNAFFHGFVITYCPQIIANLLFTFYLFNSLLLN